MCASVTRNINESLRQALGKNLSAKELAFLSRLMIEVVPTTGQLLWSESQDSDGLYLVLAGRVRLVDRQENLIVSLTAGETLGAFFLFEGAGLQRYWVRASQGATLGYFSVEDVQRMVKSYPQARDHLYEQALQRDLLVRFAQHELFQELKRSQLSEVLHQAHRHTFKPGESFSPAGDQSWWLLRQGELTRPDAQLSAGSLHRASGAESWRVNQTADLYELSQAVLEQATGKPPTESPARFVSLGINSSAPKMTPNGSVVALPAAQTSAKSPKAVNPRASNAYFPSPTLKLRHSWQRLTQRYPFAKQHSARDCGAACLLMIGKYWGKQFSLNQLRQLANVNRDGASLQGLVNAAESLGFSVRPIKGNLDGLAQKFLPAIAHWEGNHYIVVYAITHRRVIVSDPALGRRTLSRAAFQTGWTGYTLLLSPTYSLKQTPDAKQDLWRFVELVKPYSGVFLEVILASLLIQVFGLCTPILTQILLDQVITQRSISTFYAAGSGLVAV